jgi:DNA primase
LQDHAFRELVERIKLRSPIEDVVGERVSELRKRGALSWARCPFHEERTPSFAVDPRKGTWRCYGACGEGGDVLSFVQRFDGLSFLDALRLLARAVGEEVPEVALRQRSPAEDERRSRAFEVITGAQRFYSQRLWAPEGREALAYARGRGFTDETLRAFGAGWAPAQGSPLLERARAAGVDESLLLETGLVRRAEDGRLYDFFRGRWLIPIADRLGRTVGFGGRHLPGDTKALGKYVNTPETSLFHKGRLVFGLERGADAVRRARHLVLVEGYTDVMAAHQAGFPQVAAVLGTSTTEDHAALVRRSGATRVTLVFDGDPAGRSASSRALAGLLGLDLTLDVACPPQGTDPCDLLLGPGGAEEFRALLAGAREWFAWLSDELATRTGAELGRGVDEMFALLRRLPRPVEQDARLVELSARLGLSLDALRKQWQALEHEKRPRKPAATPRAPGGTGGSDQPAARSPKATDPRLTFAFRSLVGAMLLDNSLIPAYSHWEALCVDPDVRTIFRAVLELYEHGESDEPIHAGSVMTVLADHPARDLVVEIESQARTAESPLVLARDQEAWLRRRMRERELSEMRRRLTESPDDVLAPRTSEGRDDLLRNLHAKLREGRVPSPSSATPSH